MVYRKENKLSFDEARKENFIARLKQLIGNRSIRAAAKAWGLSFSTLNNYITRGTEPSFIAMQAIASVEGISLDWLAFGKNDSNKNQPPSKQEMAITNKESNTPPVDDKDFLRSSWTSAFEFMGKTEAESLLKIIINGGARGLIKLAEHEAGLDEVYALLTPDLKERAIELISAHIEAKKGASEEREIGNTKTPISGAERVNEDLETTGSQVKKSAS
ncbi:hypothetical protein DS565_15775 [Salmonella enterica subsp. enterica serovar Bareilly]|nr:hypothetical protein [Salmonella enterica subsp. enterica serovar Bareilly]